MDLTLPPYQLTRLLCIGLKTPLYSKLPWKRRDSMQVIMSPENAVLSSDWVLAMFVSFADLSAAMVV